VIEERRRDALEPERELLTVERVADRADLQELAAKISGLGQGRPGVGAQAATEKIVEPVLGLPGHQRLPQRRTMERCSASDAGEHLQGLVAFHLVDVHDLPLVQDTQVDGLLRPSMRLRRNGAATSRMAPRPAISEPTSKALNPRQYRSVSGFLRT